MTSNPSYAEVLLPLALSGTFTYRVSVPLSVAVEPGMRVWVPFGAGRKTVGIIWSITDSPSQAGQTGGREPVSPDKIKEILEVLDEKPVLDDRQMILWNWMADYYLCHQGEVMKAGLPAPLRERDHQPPRSRAEWVIYLEASLQDEDKLNETFLLLKKAPRQSDLLLKFLDLADWQPNTPLKGVPQKELLSLPAASPQALESLIQKKILHKTPADAGLTPEVALQELKPLTPFQREAVDQFISQTSQYPVQLLHGITSSGKTEIYMHLIGEELKQNRQVLYLLPEIALTTQIISRLRKFFGSRLLVYHSRFSDAQRADVWKRLASDDTGGYLVLGVRSSIFLPFRNLGLIVVDEEHENSYKQYDPAPRYHARDCAIMLGQIHQVPVLLGTATPSVESHHHALTGKYGLIRLNERYGGIELPRILLSNTREAIRKKIMHGHFTPLLLESIDQALVRGEQVILFQNRRGYSPYIECLSCAFIPRCLSCDVSMTYHRSLNRLVCHYCGRSTRVPSLCPSCGSAGMITRGLGTQKIEDEIGLLFPNARIARLDVDSTRSRLSYEKILGSFEKHEIDILIGTQMVSKGLDFNLVSLVGIMDADQLLNYPDFRSFERSFQLMVQVSGRAGRRDRQGTVIIQCSDPEHQVIQQVLNNQIEEYYQRELHDRRLYHYPPFSRIIEITLKHPDADEVARIADEFAIRLKSIISLNRMIGPQTPLVGKIQNRNLKVILVKLARTNAAKELKADILQLAESFRKQKNHAGLVVQLDVDPA